MAIAPAWNEMGVLAVRALLRGKASANQQRVGMSFIANQLCRRFDSPYIPGSTELDAGVELGRHLVGVWIGNCSAEFLEELKAAEAEAKQKAAQVARATDEAKMVKVRKQPVEVEAVLYIGLDPGDGLNLYMLKLANGGAFYLDPTTLAPGPALP